MFGLRTLGSLAMGSMRSIGALGRVPVLGTALKTIPVVGTAVTAASLGTDVYRSFNPSSSISVGGGLPPLPFNPPSAMVAQYGNRGMTTRAPAPNAEIQRVQDSNMNNLSIYGGKGKKNMLAPAQAFQMIQQQGLGLGPNYWKQKIMAPPGYVMVHNPLDKGQMLAVPKRVAQMAGLWKPHAKPPVSVRQWHAIKNAKSAIKSLKRVQKSANIITNATTANRAAKCFKRGKK